MLVAEAPQEASRKPDEMYALLERLSPNTRKLELFARSHSLHKGWMGLGGQVPGNRLLDPDVLAKYEQKYGPLRGWDGNPI